jgi:DNA-binding XRE family transcriptional regulator
MIAHTKPQIINDEKGQPAFAVVPYAEYMALLDDEDSRITLPHEVVKYIAVKGYSPLKSWRLFRGYSQEVMAEKLNVSQGNISQTETGGGTPHAATLRQWAKVLECEPNQLTS